MLYIRFPAGQIKHEHKLAEIRQAVADGTPAPFVFFFITFEPKVE